MLFRSIELVAARLADAILEGKAESAVTAQAQAEGGEAAAAVGEDGKASKSAPKARANVKRAAPKPPKA